ncbi:MAG: penicillin-binding protein activator [Alphaproteobacteria bacterium]|nr:penicillin-binding protein activator [Alphaproteobacteria bacterium]
MQVLKKIALFFLVFGLVSCNSSLTDNRIKLQDQRYEVVDYDTINHSMATENTLNVGVLLPLSGKASDIGQGMQNAMFMALDDLKNNRLMLKFYDTKSSETGAIQAAQKAINEGAELILGPLMGEEVKAMASIALSEDVPVVSFTTSPQVLQKGIYSIGLLNGEQIDRAVSYAVSQNKTRMAMLVPDNNSGLNIVKAAIMSAETNNMKLTKVAFYNPNRMDFSSIVKELSSNPDFDTVLIADNGNRLKSIASMFAYNDIMYPDVLFMGTSAWDNTNLSKETILYHSVYPMVSKSYGAYFADKYKKTFAEQPKTIYSFAYDSVLLASILSGKNRDDLNAGITGKSGFIGVNGFFKILPTGQSFHSLEMLEITKDGTKVVSPASRKNADFAMQEVDIRYIPYDNLPKFYGKSSSEVLSWLYNN